MECALGVIIKASPTLPANSVVLRQSSMMHLQTAIVSAADSVDMLVNTACIVVRTLLQTMIPITTSSAIGIQVRKAQSGPRPYCKLLFVVCWSVRMLCSWTRSQALFRRSHARSNQPCWLLRRE